MAPSPEPTAPSSAISASVSTRLMAERQDRFELLPVGADIGAGKAENGRCLRDQVRVLAGGDEGLPRRLDDVGPGAGEIGADVGGAALGAANDSAIALSQGLPCSWCRRHRCRARNSRDFSSGRIIPIKYQ